MSTYWTTTVEAPSRPPSVVRAATPSIPTSHRRSVPDQVKVNRAAGKRTVCSLTGVPPAGAAPNRKPMSPAVGLRRRSKGAFRIQIEVVRCQAGPIADVGLRSVTLREGDERSGMDQRAQRGMRAGVRKCRTAELPQQFDVRFAGAAHRPDLLRQP